MGTRLHGRKSHVGRLDGQTGIQYHELYEDEMIICVNGYTDKQEQSHVVGMKANLSYGYRELWQIVGIRCNGHIDKQLHCCRSNAH